MKIKTFRATSPEEIDKKVNEFESTHKVKFTQTNFGVASGSNTYEELYIVTVFYEDI